MSFLDDIAILFNIFHKTKVNDMYNISNTTKKNLERSIGMSLEEFSKMTADEERYWIGNKTNNKISYSKKRRHGVIGRGNPLLARRKIRTIDDLVRKSRELFGI